jgi:replicative DNA helicase
MSAPNDRLPPHAPDAERAVLGCCLEDPSLLVVAQQALHNGAEAFYDLRHREIFAALVAMENEGRGVDMIGLMSRLRDIGKLEAVGGIVYLNEIVDGVTSTQNIEAYLSDVRDKATLRAMIQTCVGTVSAAYQHAGPVMELVGQFQSEVGSLTQAHVRSADVPIATPMMELAAILDERSRGKQAITGIPTPWWYLNNMTCGLQRSEYYVIAARPSTGKTAMGVDIALHAAITGVPVLFYSIEMTAREIALRMLANRSRVNGLKLRNGFWRENKKADIAAASEQIVGLPIRIDERKSMSGQDILLGTRRAVREHNIGLIVVDYIQKLTAVRQRNSRHEELTEASGYMARVAKELNIPVVVCAQLNRDSDKDRGGKRPLLADIKDCGAIEQDADVVGLLWEPKVDESDPEEMKWLEHHQPDDPKDDGKWHAEGPDAGWREEFRRINFSIAKNRNGPTGECELVMQKASARFVDAHSPKRVKEKQGTII